MKNFLKKYKHSIKAGYRMEAIMKKLKLFLGMVALGGAMLFGKQAMAAQTMDEYMAGAQSIAFDTKVTESINAKGQYWIGDTGYIDTDRKWFKFTVPSDIGNKLIDLRIYNYAQNDLALQVYDGNQKSIYNDTFHINSDNAVTPKEVRYVVEGSENKAEYYKLTPGATYYFYIEASLFADVDGEESNAGQYIIETKTTADNSWGTFEQPVTVKPQGTVEGVYEDVNDMDSYAFTLPNDGKLYTIGFKADEKCGFGITVYDKNRKEMSPNAGVYTLIGNGQKYYVIASGPYGQMSEPSLKYGITFKSDLQKITNVSKTVVKGKKCIKVTTGTRNVTIKITCNKKILKNGKKIVKTYKVISKKGKVSVKTRRKLAKGDKITITISRKGYKTVKKTVKIK